MVCERVSTLDPDSLLPAVPAGQVPACQVPACQLVSAAWQRVAGNTIHEPAARAYHRLLRELEHDPDDRANHEIIKTVRLALLNALDAVLDGNPRRVPRGRGRLGFSRQRPASAGSSAGWRRPIRHPSRCRWPKRRSRYWIRRPDLRKRDRVRILDEATEDASLPELAHGVEVPVPADFEAHLRHGAGPVYQRFLDVFANNIQSAVSAKAGSAYSTGQRDCQAEATGFETTNFLLRL